MSIEGDIKRFIISNFMSDVPAEQLPSDLDLLETGVVDSLGLLRLITWVGDEYAIPVVDLDIAPHQFSSVDAIADFIRGERVG